jgi:hypothetical protein
MFSASKTAAPTGGFTTQRSVRLRASAGGNFTRTESAAATSNQKLTFSAWVKRGSLTGNLGSIYQAGVDASCDIIRFTNTDTLQVWFNAATSVSVVTTAVYRDPSAWYHIVVSIDTTQATAANRILIYVNGVAQTTTGTQPALNATFAQFNQNTIVNRFSYYNSTYFDGYIAEAYVIDGQALTPTSFGSYNSTTGVWQPIRYSGTYGTNGFFLNFKDNTSTTTLGYDYSGNSNNWTANNISLTAGVTYDSMTDVPTLTSATQANYAVANPLNAASGLTISDGNLKLTASTSTSKFVNSSFALPSSGAYYAEITFANASTSQIGQNIGVALASRSLTAANSASGAYLFYASSSGNLFSNGTQTGSGLSVISANEVFQVAIDVTNSKMWIGRSNVWYNSTGGTTGNPSTGANPTFTAAFADYFIYAGFDTTSSVSANFNFGQRPFSYTPPTGFVALNTFNLPAPTIPNGATNFAATTYTGNGGTQSIVNTVNSVSFQPDFVWVKGRSNAQAHHLFDSVRGVQKALFSNLTNAEITYTDELSAFNSNGFTLGLNTNVNGSAQTYVGWQWKASNAAAVTNTSGSISSQVSANPSAGFSIVTYTGNGTASTVGHGLGITPKLILVKPRSGIGDWITYSSTTGAGNYLLLNTTAASTANVNVWNNTSPTSSVFSVGVSTGTNQNTTTYVAYCFSEIAGYSKFGSYTGNGSTDGPFVYLGFRPRFVLFKTITDGTTSWLMMDSSRSVYNLQGANLFPNLANAEGTTGVVDFLSNGFKPRINDLSVNGSGGTYIYAAFAENPFNYSLAR